jgi:hypothetical protein
MAGMIVVRPKAAWDDPSDPINRAALAFHIENGSLTEAVHLLLNSTRPSLAAAHTDLAVPARPIDRPFSATFAGGTMLEALNTIARAHRDAKWQAQYLDGRPTLIFTTLDLSGGAVMAPIASNHR